MAGWFALTTVLVLMSSAGDSSPRFLPAPPLPAGNPLTAAKIELGKALFWDEQLSSTRTMACGTCHRPNAGGSDPRSVFGSARALNAGPDGRTPTGDDVIGSPGVPLHGARYDLSALFGMEEQVTRRHAPSIINAAYFQELFTDGRARGALLDTPSGDTLLAGGAALENQVLGPISSGVEMASAHEGWANVIARLRESAPLALASRVPGSLTAWISGRGYPALFAEAFGSPGITPARIAMAIASYERTQISDQAPLDSLLAGIASLTPDEAAGRALFEAHGCSGCHTGPLLTDGQFHYIGVRPAHEDSGRAAITRRPEDLGAFRTPSLRNVSLRPVFMHGGQLHSLEAAINFYYLGGTHQSPNKSPLIQHRFITRDERRLMVAFLGRPLTDPRVALEQPPFDRPALYTESGLAPVVLHDAASISGSSGIPPEPLAVEPPALGNPDFTLAVYGALGGALATLVVDEHDPGVTPHSRRRSEFLRRSIRLAGVGVSDGHASIDMPIPDRRSLLGKVLLARWYVEDPGARNGTAVSPPIRLQLFGPHGRGGQLAAHPVSPTMRLLPPRYSGDGEFLTLRFDLASAEPAQIAILDSLGEVIRKLSAGHASGPGTFSVVWDGRDSTGSAVPRGRYFAKLSTSQASRRMVVLGGR